MNKHVPHEATNGPVAWVALVISICALLLSGSMYFDLYNVKQQIENAAEATVETAQDAAVETRAAIVASARAMDRAIPEEELAREIAELRRDIAVAAESASEEAQQELAELDRELEMIEDEARSDSAAAVDSFQKFAETVERDLRTDEEGNPIN